ncbi:hypothetical protein J7I90_25320 [Bacillus sp. ISL-57]|nr:hypothetical protein [Bacillus sp. ISL-57]
MAITIDRSSVRLEPTLFHFMSHMAKMDRWKNNQISFYMGFMGDTVLNAINLVQQWSVEENHCLS